MWGYSSEEERLLCKQRATGSNPAISTNERMVALSTLKAVRFSLCLTFVLLLSVMLTVMQTTKEQVKLPDIISSVVVITSVSTLSQNSAVAAVSQVPSSVSVNHSHMFTIQFRLKRRCSFLCGKRVKKPVVHMSWHYLLYGKSPCTRTSSETTETASAICRYNQGGIKQEWNASA